MGRADVPALRHAALLAAEARALLAFERSRAAGFPLALRAWQAGLQRRAAQLGRLGWTAHGRLLAAEAACRHAGLSFAAETPAPAAPWHLPERLLDAPASALPAHPLLLDGDGGIAAATRPATPTRIDPLQALRALLSPEATAARWRRLPTVAPGRAEPRARIAVCLHLYYVELWPALWAQLRRLPEPFDLVVTVPAFACTDRLDAIVDDCPGVRFAPMPNRGRDVLPWLRLLADGVFDGYELVCKLHGKKSPHTDRGSVWRERSIGALIGNGDNIRRLLAAVRADRSIGLLGPTALAVTPGGDAWHDKSTRHLRWLSRRLGATPCRAAAPFFAGTMFWFRPPALRCLAALGLRADHFAPEMAQTDGTLAHAVERFVATAVAAAGYRTIAWDDRTHAASELLRPAVDSRADTLQATTVSPS